MKRINLTENDIFNIVNRVIAEQTPETKTTEEKIKRFLSGDSTGPGLKDRTFPLKDKRGLNKDLTQFIVKNVELFDTQSKGTGARVKGIIYGQSQPETEETVFELICGSFGDFKLVKYKGLDGTKVEVPKPVKEPKPVEPEKEKEFYDNPDKIDQPKLDVSKDDKQNQSYTRFEYIRKPYQASKDGYEEYAGIGVMIYISEEERFKYQLRNDNTAQRNPTGGGGWFGIYDKSEKVLSDIIYYNGLGGPTGESNLIYLFATEKNSSEGVRELINFIKPQFTSDLNFYGIKQRKRFNLDEITDKSRNVKVYKTQGKDNKNYNIILLRFN